MSLPKDAEQLGSCASELAVSGSGASTIVPIQGENQRNLSAHLAKAALEVSPHRVYLALENIRGTFDASVLNVYLNLPEGAAPGEHRHLLAGSIGMFGLRAASSAQGDNQGLGLEMLFDITKILLDPASAKSLSAGELRVNIEPHRPLPENTVIKVGRISVISVPAK